MGELQMGVNETRFAEIIWANAPITATELAKFGEQEFNWKKTTSYTVLKRLCNKGIFQNQNGVVTVLISREKFYSIQSENFVEETFKGSLPAFLAAFTARRSLSKEDVAQLRKMVEEYEEEK